MRHLREFCRNFLIGAILLNLLLACTQRAEPLTKPVMAKLPETNSADVVGITEVCYKGTVYLLNTKGGMAPKTRMGINMMVEECKE
jgi:hypothetical protein